MVLSPLPRDFYSKDTLDVAKDLLGKYIVYNEGNERLMGKIVETEAYVGPLDKAAHSFNNRRTSRNDIMYGPPGFAYIFSIYGMHYCLNVVTGAIGKPEAVLIRAVEPVEGLNAMSRNRFHKDYDELDWKSRINLTNGPGKLCQAFGINKSNYGDDLLGERLYLTYGQDINPAFILSSPRINIDYAEEAKFYPWRFYIKDNPYVSCPNYFKKKPTTNG